MQVSKVVSPAGNVTAVGFPTLHKLVTVFAPLGFLAVLLVFKIVDKATYATLIAEDGFFENLSFLFYLIASGFAMAAGVTLLRRGERAFGLIYVVLALGFFYIAGEEISWGQRIFNIESFGIFATANIQGEINSHNFLHRYVLHATYIIFSGAFAFAWYVVPQLLTYLPAKMRGLLAPRAWLLMPDRRLMLYFLPCMLLYSYYDSINPMHVLLWGPEWHINKSNQELFSITSKDQEPS